MLLPLIALGLATLFNLPPVFFIEVGMQNAAQAILYSLMMNIVLLIYVGAVRRGPGPRAARRRDSRH